MALNISGKRSDQRIRCNQVRQSRSLPTGTLANEVRRQPCKAPLKGAETGKQLQGLRSERGNKPKMRKEGLSTGLSHPGLERKAVGASCLEDRGQEDSHNLERCVRPSLPRNTDVHITGSEAQPYPAPGGGGRGTVHSAPVRGIRARDPRHSIYRPWHGDSQPDNGNPPMPEASQLASCLNKTWPQTGPVPTLDADAGRPDLFSNRQDSE